MPGPFDQPYPNFYGTVEPLPPQNPFASIPGLDGPMGQMFGQMAFQPLMQQLLGPGYVPMQFSPTQNFYDHLQSQQFAQQRFRAMSTAAQADIRSMMDIQRGMARLAGNEMRPGSPMEARAQTFATDLSRMLPVFAQMMPETADAFFGPRGSATIMADQVFRAGRHMFDPNTGLVGLSGEEAGRFSAGLHSELYGTEERVRDMRGMGAGRAGVLMREMVSRGLMSSPRSNTEVARLMAQRSGMGNDVQGFLTGAVGEAEGAGTTPEMLASPQFQNMARRFNIEQSGQQIRDMNRVVSAMQDLFGANGRPNAPIPELLNNIQVLTQGGLQSMSADRLEQTVRLFQATGQVSNMSHGQMMQLNQGVAQMLAQRGLDPTASEAITRHAAAFGSAHGAETGGHAVFGRMGRDQAIALDARLTTNAAASPGAIAANAVIALSENNTIGRDTELFQLQDAIRRGATNYTFDGETRQVHQSLSHERLTRIAGGAGINQQLLETLLSNPAGTEQFTNITAPVIRRMQRQGDLPAMFGGEIVAGMRQITNNEAETGTMGMSFLNAAIDMDQATFANVRLRNEELARRTVGADRFNAMSEDERRRTLQGVQSTYAMLDNRAREMGYGHFVNVRDMFNEATLQATEQRQQQAARQAELSQVFSTTNREGFAARAFQAVTTERFDAQGRPRAPQVGEIAGEMLGAQSTDALRAELTRQLDQLQARRNEYVDANTTGQRREEIQREIRRLVAGLDQFGVTNNLPGLPGGLNMPQPPQAPQASAISPAMNNAQLNVLGGLLGAPGINIAGQLVGNMPQPSTPPAAAAGAAAAAIAAPATPTAITGTLTLIGLNRALLQAQGMGANPVVATPAPGGP